MYQICFLSPIATYRDVERNDRVVTKLLQAPGMVEGLTEVSAAVSIERTVRKKGC